MSEKFDDDGYKIPPKKITPGKMTERERERLKRQHASWLWYIFKCAIIGAALGIITTWLFLESNLNGFGEMVARSPNRIGFTALLALSFASTFGALGMGTGIMIRSDHPEKFDE